MTAFFLERTKNNFREILVSLILSWLVVRETRYDASAQAQNIIHPISHHPGAHSHNTNRFDTTTTTTRSDTTTTLYYSFHHYNIVLVTIQYYSYLKRSHHPYFFNSTPSQKDGFKIPIIFNYHLKDITFKIITIRSTYKIKPPPFQIKRLYRN